MRIAIDGNEGNTRERVGTGQYTYNILKEWTKTKSHTFDIYLREPPVEDLPKESSNWHYHVVGPNFAWTRVALPLALATGSRHDVFWNPAHYLPPFTFGNSVVTIHDLAYELFPDLFNKRDLYQLKTWTRQSVAQATRVIAVSQATKQDLIKLYHVPATKIDVVYNGYDSRLFNTTAKLDATKLDQYKIINNKYILFVNTIQPRKNVVNLVRAFELLQKNGYPGKLVIAGKIGWMADESLAAVHNSPSHNDIVLTGYIRDSLRQVLYRYADLTVLPSLYEGFGISLLESMASGTPVVGSNNSSIGEVIGQAGELFDPYNPKDMMKAITQVQGNRQAYVAKSLKQAAKFSWEKCAADTLKVLTSVQ